MVQSPNVAWTLGPYHAEQPGYMDQVGFGRYRVAQYKSTEKYKQTYWKPLKVLFVYVIVSKASN